MRKITKANVSGWLAMALPALMPVAAFAEPLTLDAQPSAAPSVVAPAPVVAPDPVPAAAPLTVPAAPAPNPLIDPALSTGKILILPFQADNPNDATPWLGKSIQESMMADLTVAAPDRVKVTDQAAATADAAIALGKQNGARYVIAGGFATIDHELRIAGKVLDVETGKSVAGLKVTGDPSQLFHMEDALALQVRAQVLGQQVGPMQPPAVDQTANPQAAPVNGGVTPDSGAYANPTQQPYVSQYAVAPAPTIYGADTSAAYPAYVSGFDPYYYPAGYAYSPYYPYYCDYGYYGGCYPFGLGFGFFFGNGFSHFGHGHDFRGRGFDGRGGIVGGGRSSLGVGVGLSAGVRTSNFRAGVSVSPGFARSAARVTSGASSFRASSAGFTRSSSFGRAASIGGFHASGGFASHGSFGGGGGFSHGGSGGHGGGGHR